VEKYCRVGKDTFDNMAHEHCMLDIENVILIAFLRKQWLRERAWMLRYKPKYIACVVKCIHVARSKASHKQGEIQ